MSIMSLLVKFASVSKVKRGSNTHDDGDIDINNQTMIELQDEQASTFVIDGNSPSDLENNTGDPNFLEVFPEGGLDAWKTVFGSFLGLTATFGVVNSMSAIETYISHNQLEHVSASSVGWIFSIFSFVSLITGILTGDFFDAKGPKIPILVGSTFFVSGVLATGNCSKIYQFILAFGIVTGLGIGIQINALIVISSHYFDKKRGLAIGCATVGGSFGGALYPVILKKLYSSLGFTWAMRCLALILGVFELSAFFLITPRFPPRNLNSVELPIYKKFLNFWKNSIDIKGFKDPRFLFCVLATTLSETFLVCTLTYFGSYCLSKGNSENTSYILITVINASGIPSRALAGYLSDKIGKFNLMTSMVFLCSIFCVAIWLPGGSHPAALYAFSVVYGISSSGVLSLIPVCIGQISRVESFGLRYSTTYFVTSIGCLVGIPLAGLFIGTNPSSKDYDNFIIFTAMIGFACSLCWVISRYFAVGFKLCIY